MPSTMLRAVDVRPGEGPRLLLLALLAMLAVAQAVLIRTFSDAIFLGTFPADRLPFFFLANAVIFLPTTFAYGALSRRLSRPLLHAAMLGLFALLSLGSGLVLGSQAAVFTVVLLLAVISPLVNVIAWSSILARLNSREARRLVPLISAGATLGGIVAGLLAIPYIRLLGLDQLLLPIAGANLLLALLVGRSAGQPGAEQDPALERARSMPDRRSPIGEDAVGAGQASNRDLFTNHLLMLLSAVVLLMSLCTNLADYAFKDVLQRHYALEVGEMGVFLAYYHSLTNVIILVVQLLLVGRVVRAIGLQASFALHPLVMLLGLLGFVLLPVLSVAALWKLSDGLFKFAFHGPILEMAVTPVPRGLRDRARALLKGTMHPLGGFLAGALLLLVGLVADEALWKVLPGVALSGGLWLVLTMRLKARYLEQLRSTLCTPELVTIPELSAADARGEPAPFAEVEQLDGGDLRTRSGVLRMVDGQVRILQQAVAEGSMSDEQLKRALDRLFVLLGDLGDRATVDLVRRRYQRGNLATKAIALELLEMHLEERRVAEAVSLLESLAPEMVERAAQQRAEAKRQQEATLGGRVRTLLLRR